MSVDFLYYNTPKCAKMTSSTVLPSFSVHHAPILHCIWHGKMSVPRENGPWIFSVKHLPVFPIRGRFFFFLKKILLPLNYVHSSYRRRVVALYNYYIRLIIYECWLKSFDERWTRMFAWSFREISTYKMLTLTLNTYILCNIFFAHKIIIITICKLTLFSRLYRVNNIN